MTLPADSQFSDTPTGMQSSVDALEKTFQPGHQTVAQSQDPLNSELYPPDWTFDPIGYSRWKKEQSPHPEHAGT